MKRVTGLYPDWGIFVVRITIGSLFLVHGWQKFAVGLGRVTGDSQAWASRSPA